ncbi:MAG TPA: hypothetical protein VGM43_16895 [Bryobacteraceae bacterium]|jgi:hypothetical protein
MHKVLTISLLSVFSLAAQAPAKTTQKAPTVKAATIKATAKTTAAKPSTPKTIEIPKDAVLQSDGRYGWTDKDGKSWTFVRTPFGVMKLPAKQHEPAAPSLANAKAIDAGDKVRFETKTPFGVMSHEKKKADLTDEERKLYESQNPTQAKQN